MLTNFSWREWIAIGWGVLVSVAAMGQQDFANRTPRVFFPQGCHNGHRPFPDAPVNDRFLNYDMSESIARSDSFDVHSYEVSLDVTEYNLQQITAHARIALEVLDDAAADLWFDLIDLEVDSVHMDGEPAAFEHVDGQLHVAPGADWVMGNEHEIEVWYGGHPYADPYWGGVYFIADYIYQLGIGLTSIPPNFGKVWHPCFDNFVERATYTWHVTSAGGRKAHLQGTFLGETLLGGDTVLRSFTLEHPITTHLAAFAVSNYVDSNYVHTGAYGEVPVRLTGKPTHINGMVNKFQDLGYAIDALEYWWGPYAWERVGYVLTTDGALEIPTNIAYPQFMVDESIAANGDLFAHELGHHWWGNLIAPTIHNHMWLKEGPAEYSSHLFVEWKDGPEAFVDLVKDNQLYVLEQAHLQDDGFHPLSPMPDEHIYGRHTYYKGAAMLHNLRAYLGDEAFRSGMQDVLAQLYDAHMDAEVFRTTLEGATGADLQPFFDALIYQPGFATWVIDSMAVAPLGAPIPATTLYLQQKLRACENFHEEVPLDVTVWDAEWNRVEGQITASGATDEIIVEHIGITEPAMIALNANGKLNQGRMDHTFAVTGTQGLTNLPWVAMRVGCDAMPEGDSALVRIEHHWAAPDAGPLAPYVDELSETHFWVVDGIWPENEGEMVLDARLQYYGNEAEDLDYPLYGTSEEQAFLAWRPRAGEPWVEYMDYEWQGGSLTNGSGIFKILNLRKGQYAFAKGDVSVGVAEAKPLVLTLYPNPAVDQITVLLEPGEDTVQIFDALGRKVAQRSASSSRMIWDVSDWENGTYHAVVGDRSAVFLVAH